jgi:hypothetical protein
MSKIDDLKGMQVGTVEQVSKFRSEALSELSAQTHRANVLAATIRDLIGVITFDGETKQEFIGRVRNILADDSDKRVQHKL